MKSLIHSIFVLCAFWAQNSFAAQVTYRVDTSKSTMRWTGTFTGASVEASLKLKSGQFMLSKTKIASGEMVADMKSFQSDSGMDVMLKGPTLLKVEAFPTASLKVKEVHDVHAFAPGGPNAHLVGTVVFQGRTLPAEGDFVLKVEKNTLHATGKFDTVYGKMLKGAVTYDIWAKK